MNYFIQSRYIYYFIYIITLKVYVLKYTYKYIFDFFIINPII